MQGHPDILKDNSWLLVVLFLQFNLPENNRKVCRHWKTYRLQAVCLLLKNLKGEYLSSVFKFAPSQFTGLRCSNTLAYRFLSWRETAHSLKDIQHNTSDVPPGGSQPGIKTQFFSLCTLTHPFFYHLFLCIWGCYKYKRKTCIIRIKQTSTQNLLLSAY